MTPLQVFVCRLSLAPPSYHKAVSPLVNQWLHWICAHLFFGVQVTHGSVIKLQHERTKFRLHSHEVPYGSGSQQQSVTGFPGVEDANSFWVRILPSYRNEDTNGSMNFWTDHSMVSPYWWLDQSSSLIKFIWMAKKVLPLLSITGTFEAISFGHMVHVILLLIL